MANDESAKVIPAVLMTATAKGWRLFRNSVGEAWAGKGEQVIGGGVMIKAPRRITYGLKVGSSDLIGLRPVVITPEMVGQTIGQFVSIECKTLAYKKTTTDQDDWLAFVVAFGGAAFVARETKGGGVDLVPIESD